MDRFVDYYRDVLGFAQLIHYDDKVIHTDYSALMSKVMTNGNGRIKFPINEPATGKKKSQIQEYLDWYRSPGCQHIALRTEDIVTTVRRLRDNGVEFLGMPHEYYASLADRVGDVGVPIDTLEELGIEADRDEEGYLLQIFTPPGPGPPDLLLRDHRAPRLARLRRRQLQGPLRSHRTRAGEAREPLVEAPAPSDMALTAITRPPGSAHHRTRPAVHCWLRAGSRIEIHHRLERGPVSRRCPGIVRGQDHDADPADIEDPEVPALARPLGEEPGFPGPVASVQAEMSAGIWRSRYFPE